MNAWKGSIDFTTWQKKHCKGLDFFEAQKLYQKQVDADRKRWNVERKHQNEEQTAC